MRLIKIFSVLIIVSLLLCSCTKGGNTLTVETSPLDKSLIELSPVIYEKSELMEIAEFEGSINELNGSYPIKCIRMVNGIYRVSYLGAEYVAILIFDNFGNKISGNIYNIQHLKSDFNVLEKGESIETVINFDSQGEYLFLYTGRNDLPRRSTHYTQDGYLITIDYSSSNTIMDIRIELI